MDQCEDREEGVPPSETTQHESQTTAQRNPPGPGPGPEPEPGPGHECEDIFLYSPNNICIVDNFYFQGRASAAERNQNRPEPEPEPSCVSLKSDWSHDRPVNFKGQQRSAAERFYKRPSETELSCVSLESDWSHYRPVNFKEHQPSAAERAEPAGVRWLIPGLRKYSCQLTIDTNTVNKRLQLSDNNRKVTRVKEVQSYPDHPDRFDYWEQLLCRDGLTGRCYWEVEWRGRVYISVSYRRISRKGDGEDCLFGLNDLSWSLSCSDDGPRSVWHNNRETPIPFSPSSSSSSSSSSVSNRVAVYVDCPAGTLSFYKVSSDSLIHLHTINTTFTETLYAGFRVSYSSSVSLVWFLSLPVLPELSVKILSEKL